MDDKFSAESNSASTNFNSIDVIVSFPSYKFTNHMQSTIQSTQLQHYPKLNSMSNDYIASNRSTMIDINNNNNNNISAAGLNSYGTSFPQYYNDPNSMMNSSNNTNNNNNNILNYQNQNYKIPSKYAMNGSQIPPTQCTAVNTSSLLNTTSACPYARTFGGASCYNQNRYMPYNHSRACATAAAAAAVTMDMRSRSAIAPFYSSNNCATKISTAITTAGSSNGNIVPPLLYSSYQQLATSYPNIIPLTSQPSNMPPNNNVQRIGMETSNPYLMATYDRNAIPSTTQVDCSRYNMSMVQSNFTRPKSTDSTTIATYSNNSHKSHVHNGISYATSVPCTSGATASAAGTVVSSSNSTNSTYASVTDLSQAVSIRLTNLDFTIDEESLRKFLLSQLKPITPVVSLTFEDSNFVTLTVPDSYFAKQVVANLHRKKVGHKRMVVSYTRDSSLIEANTLRCQVAGLLKDVPHNRLPMYKFRELFQSRFKTSISVLDLYTMRDICTINTDGNDEKYITLLPNLVNSLENSPLMEGLQHTVPYCKEHFKREQHKGWAEQEIEPLPNVFMAILEIQNIIYPLLKNHHGDIPISSLVHCIEGQMKIKIESNDNGVNLEHLVCCIQGIKIQVNNFGIKILSWLETDRRMNAGSSSSSSSSSATATGALAAASNSNSSNERSLYYKSADPLSQITREVIELVKMSPKSTMKFSRFIPAYHNHFGKQCRVADYGYTKLIELFEALSSVVQIMGDGENRQITLTHRTQIRRFTSDLLRVLRSSGNKSILLSELPEVFAKIQNRNFDITEYGVCDIGDILDGLVHSNVVVITKVHNGKDILISIPKRQQTSAEIAKTSVFAGEMVELFQNAPQYTILFQKFVRSYHYHFAYQCRLSDYGFLKLADLMEAINGVVEMDRNNDEDRRIFLSPAIARRVFAEQAEELIRVATGSSKTSVKLKEVLKLHKKKYGYQMQPETLGVKKLIDAIELLPYVEMCEENEEIWIICHNHDPIFRTLCYRACKHLLAYDPNKYRSLGLTKTLTTDLNTSAEQKRKPPSLDDFIIEFNAKYKENLNINMVKAMRYAIEIFTEGTTRSVRISEFMNLVINIVRLLEQRSLMLLSDIKIAMNCTSGTTFSFGYPNLYSLLSAYPDIFIVNLGVSQEGSEVRLAPNCELVTQRTFSNSNPKPLSGVTTNTTTTKTVQSKPAATRATRTPLGEYNVRTSSNVSNYNGPPAAKIRNIMPTAVVETPTTMIDDFKTPILTVNFQQPNAEMLTALNLSNRNLGNNMHNLSSGGYKVYPNISEGSGYASLHNSTLLNSSFINANGAANKENLFNNSFNVSFNASSNSSLIDLNGSLSTANTTSLLSSSSMSYSGSACNNNNNASKLWERRQDTNIHCRQQLSTMEVHNGSVQNNCNSMQETGSGIENATVHHSLPPLSIHNLNTKSQTLEMPLMSHNSLYSIVNCLQNGPPGTPLYDPPKPDTPPGNNAPFWVDPVWSQGLKKIAKKDLINTCIKPSGEHIPTVLSPYTLSKIVNSNKPFNFEMSVRKIT